MTVDGGGSMRVRGQRWRFYRDARGPRHGPWAGGGGETGLRDSCWAERANYSGSGSVFFKPKQIQFKFKFEEFDFKLNGKS